MLKTEHPYTRNGSQKPINKGIEFVPQTITSAIGGWKSIFEDDKGKRFAVPVVVWANGYFKVSLNGHDPVTAALIHGCVSTQFGIVPAEVFPNFVKYEIGTDD